MASSECALYDVTCAEEVLQDSLTVAPGLCPESAWQYSWPSVFQGLPTGQQSSTAVSSSARGPSCTQSWCMDSFKGPCF